VPLPDPAATVLLLRPSLSGFEVLMVERNARGFFGSMFVFPGGAVEDVDIPEGVTADDDLALRNAAIRELAEETGILLTNAGAVRAPEGKGARFYELLAGQPSPAAVDALVLVSRWVTPEVAPRRFDARFYLAGCEDPPEVLIDRAELVDHEWVTPAAAIARHEAGVAPMMLPTLAHLRWLERRASIQDAVSSARGADGRTLIEPRRGEDGSILPVHLPAEAT